MSNLPVPSKEKMNTLKKMLDVRMDTWKKLIPKHMTPERMVQVALTAVSRNPLLLECSPESFLKSFIFCGQVGLEPRGAGGVWLVPYKNNKTGKYEATPQIDYRGKIELALRSDKVSDIDPQLVHENDFFDFEFGTNEHLHHKFPLTGRGKVIGGYAIVKYKDGTIKFRVYPLEKLEEAKHASRDKRPDAIWNKHPEEMLLKTIVHRISSYIPQTAEVSRALEVEDKIEAGGNISDIIDIPAEDIGIEEPPKKTRTQQIKESLDGGKASPESPTTDDKDDTKAIHPLVNLFATANTREAYNAANGELERYLSEGIDFPEDEVQNALIAASDRVGEV